MDKLISIILPVYNGERFLAESIESVIAQTYKNWELIIVDDCSSDGTVAIAKQYSKQDNRIQFYQNEKNLKLPGNLNRGFALASGEYLTWTSDDNRFRPNALECMAAELKSHKNVDLVYASYSVIDENGEQIQYVRADQRGKEHICGANVVGACFLYTRRAYDLVGNYDESLFLVEDFDYWQRMLAQLDSFAIDEVLYDYRWHANSLTSTKRVVQFGKVTQIMLEKNKVLFGQMNVEQKHYYYKCLHKSYDNQGKIFPFSARESFYRGLCRTYNLFRRIIRSWKAS